MYVMVFVERGDNVSWKTYAMVIHNGVKQTYRMAKDTIAENILFWGPDTFLDIYNDCVMDDADETFIGYSEYGAAVIDLDNKHLLFFGGENLATDILLRKLYIKLLHKTWHGFSIQWAQNGTADIANYLGFQLNKEYYKLPSTPLRLTNQIIKKFFTNISPSECEGILTIQANEFLYIYPFCGYSRDILLAGERIMECASGVTPLEQYIFEYDPCRPHEFLSIGIHLIPAKKELFYWNDNPYEIRSEWVEQCWPGWSVRYWGDAFENHLQYTGDRLKLLHPSEEFYNNNIRSIVASSWVEEIMGVGLKKRFDKLFSND